VPNTKQWLRQGRHTSGLPAQASRQFCTEHPPQTSIHFGSLCYNEFHLSVATIGALGRVIRIAEWNRPAVKCSPCKGRSVKEHVLASRTLPYNQAHHRFAVFLACATLLLIIAGALVTSNDAGLSVPDWPTSFGSLYKMPPMVGGVKYEHGHRMFAEFIGLLIILMAIWTQRVEQRTWMKALGWIALAAVVGQGILGGLTVLFFLPWAISTAHATLAQTIFCAVVAMALFTSRSWLQESAPIYEHGLAPSTNTLTTVTAACIWIQLILGAAFRHSGMKLLPHLIGACVVAAMICWTVIRVLTHYGSIPQLRKPAQWLLALLLIQLGLGFASWVTRLQWMLDAPQPTTNIVLSTVSHVAGGALVLATSVILAIQTRRMIPSHAAEFGVQSAPRKAVA
jgi:cytochrome c oxidase assembly protein subunit 15